MDIAQAQQFLRDNRCAVLATTRRNGQIQMSPVTVSVDADGRAIISSRETAYKVRNLRRNPQASICVFVDEFTGPWIQVNGRADILALPEAMEPLVEYYRQVAGEHSDWDDYRRAMQTEQRVLVRITIDSAGPDRQG